MMDYVTNMTILLFITSVASQSTDFISFVSTTTVLEDPCIKGSCIVITDCNYAMQLLRHIRTKPDTIKRELKDLHCGFTDTNKTPKVCCPDINTIVYTKSEETATNRPKPSTTPLTLDHQTLATRAVPTTEATATNEMSVETQPPAVLADPFPNRKICGRLHAVDRIIGGTVTAVDEFPWMAQIKYIDDYGETSLRCAATLITDRHLISAAHCFQPDAFSAQAVSVRLGVWNTESPSDCYEGQCPDKPVEIDIEKVLVHPQFNTSAPFFADIAIITLKQPVNFTDFIQPICLPTTEYVKMQDYLRESVYWAVGWGVTEFGQPSPVKRKVDLDAVPIDICRAVLDQIPESSSKVLICAGGRAGKDSCSGDSGGPLMREVSEDYELNWFLYGITSYGTKQCGKEGQPAVYTRVTVFMPWIRQVVQT